jgi:hypothetical protein
MKKVSSFLLALVAALLMASGAVKAQTWNNTSPGDWQSANWGIPMFWPGLNNDNSAAIINPVNPNSLIINNAVPANPIGNFTIGASTVDVLLNGTGTLIINGDLTVNSRLTIGSGMTVLVRGALKGSSVIILRAGATLRLESTATTAVQGTVTITGAQAGSVVLGPGFNGGVILSTLFQGQELKTNLTINSNMSLSGNLATLSTSGALTLNGNLSVNSLTTLTLRQTGTNSLQGAGRIVSAGGTVNVGNGNQFNGGLIPGDNFANPFTGPLILHPAGSGVTAATLSGNLNIGAGGSLTLQGGTTRIVAGSSVRIANTLPNSITQPPGGGFLAIDAGGSFVYGPGANAGQLNLAVVATNANGTIRTEGPMTLQLPGANQTITPFGIAPTAATFTGSLDLGGDLTLSGAGTLRLTSLAPNALTGTGRIVAPDLNSEVRLDPGFNAGIVRGENFACPFNGVFSFSTGATFDIQGTLCLGGPVGLYGLVNITPGAELRLSYTGSPATFGIQGVTGGIVAVNNTSVLRLSPGYSSGVLPLGNSAFIQSSTTGTTGFKGRLIVESNQVLARSLTMEPGSILDLSPGSLTVSNASTVVTQLFLNNQGSNSLTGTGFLQATGGTGTAAPQIVLGPSFNNGVIPAARFANPYLGALSVTAASALALQGTLTMGVPTTTSGSLILGSAQLTINTGSRLVLNSRGRDAIVTSATAPGFIQGLNCSSALELGPGFSNGRINATGATGFLASTFNGNLIIQGRGGAVRPMEITNAVITIGPQGCLTLNDDISVSPNSILNLNNTGAGSLSGVGRIGGYFGNDFRNLPLFPGANDGLPRSAVNLGVGFNGGVLNANNFLSPFTADLTSPISPLTMTGSLSFAETGATLKLQAPGQLTLAANSILTFATNANAIWGTGKIQGTDLTSQITLGAGKGFNSGWSGFEGDAGSINPPYPTGINAEHFVSPFIGTMNISAPPVNTNRPVIVTNGTLSFAPVSLLNLIGPVVVTGGSSVVLGMTAPNSLIGSTLGTIQGTSNTVVIELGPGFNANQIPGARFGPTSNPFVGILRLPASGAMTLAGSVTMASIGSARTGHLELRGSNLTIADAVVLTLSAATSNTVLPLTSNGGVLQGATNTSEVIFPLPVTVGLFTVGEPQPALMTATFATPFNGRLSIGTTNPYQTPLPVAPDRISYSIPTTGTLTLGAENTANGVLNIATSATLAVQNGATLVLNNIASTGASLPGGGNISGVGPNANIRLGPGALGATIPGSVFDNPFVGNLITSPGPLMTLTQPGMTFDGPGDVSSFTANGNVAIGANATMTFNNQTANRLVTNGGVISAADPATSRFVFGPNANGGIIPGALFADPFTGTIETQSAMTLSNRLTMGQPNSFNGVLLLGGQLTVPNGVPAGANLALNNRNPEFIALPGGQLIDVQGVANGATSGQNGRLTLGPGALSTSANIAVIPNNRLVDNSVNGTIETSTGSATIISGTLVLSTHGTLRIAGNTTGTSIVYSTMNQVLLGQSAILRIMNADSYALDGQGVVQGTGVRSQVYFAANANGGTIPGNNFGQHYLGQIYADGPMALRGDLRLHPTYQFDPTTGASIQLGGTLTVQPGARLSLWNTTATVLPSLPAGGAIGGLNAGSVANPQFGTVVLAPNFLLGVINQAPASPLLTPEFNGFLITSTGTTTVTNGPLTFGAEGDPLLGTLELGGPFNAGATVALTFNNRSYRFINENGPLSHAVTPGAVGARVQANAAGSSITLGNGFNGGYYPNAFFGDAGTFTPNCGTPLSFQTVGNGVGNGQLNIRGPLALTVIPDNANLRVNGTLQFGNAPGPNAAGRLVIATGGTLSAAVVQNVDPANPGGVAAAAPTSVFDLPANANINNSFPILGASSAIGFTGRVRVNGQGTQINGVTVTIAPSGTLELCNNAFLSLANVANTTLNLNNTGSNSLTGTGLILGTNATNSYVNFGAGFNGGQIPGSYFGSQANPFNGGMRLAGNTPANTGAGSLSVSSALWIGSAGAFDFTANSSNKLTLASPASILGSVINSGPTQYFVTAPSALTLGNVGNVTFPVGPTSALFTPININNNAVPSQFSVRALASPTQAAPAPQVRVNQQWNVTQVTGVTPGFAVSISPFWLPSQQSPGFSSAFAVANAFTPGGTVSSSPGQATNDPLFTNYLRNTVTVVQGATNQLNDTPILVTSQPIPNILAFTPMAQTSGGTVTITGNRFVAGASVSLGGVPVPMSAITFISGGASGIDTLRVVVPANAASGNVVVTQTAGSSTAPGFVFLGGPLVPSAIFKVTPSPIPAGIGDVEVIIDGAAFGSNTLRVVAVGSGITSTIVPSSSSVTRITATIPGQVVRVPGTLQLTVTSLDRLPSSTNVTITTPPALSLTSLAPSSTSGNLQPFTIAVNGSNFSAQSTFTLNGVVLRVVSVTPNANGTLTARVELPAGVRSGDLTITNINGQSASLPFVVNSLPRPIVTSVNPVLLPPGSPNTTITINGRFLVPGAQVFFNGQPLTGVQLTGDSLIRVTIPAALLANPDLAVLTVTNPDGQSIGYRLPITTAAPGALTVNLNGVNPGSTTGTGRAFQLQIAGTGFAGAPQVFLGGQPLTVVSTSGTQLVVNVPANLNFAGTYTLQIVNPSGVSTSVMYTINPASTDPAPAITRVNPGQFIAGAAGNITITGSGFATGARVLLGTLQLTVVSVSPTTVVATIPASVAAGTYQLSVVNPDGQAAVQTYGVVTSVSSNPLAGVRVYPNPAIESVSVEANLERAAKVVVTVTNALGQRVMVSERNAAAGFFSQSLDVSNLPAGSYMVEITDGVRRSVEKIIKN